MNYPSPPQAHQKGLHCIADAKYPIVPVEFDFEAVVSVLDRIRTTSKPINFNWYRLDRPKNGEVFMEYKFPLHVVDGHEVFPVNDDGYCWSSAGTSKIVSFKGCDIEITRWTEGFTPGERTFNISKVEYRLKLPQNYLFLTHYLAIAQPTVPVRLPVVPTIKADPNAAPLRPNPVLVPENPSATDGTTPSPAKTLAKPTATATVHTAPKPTIAPTSSKTKHASSQTTATPAPPASDYAPTLDALDQVDEFESAAHRFTVMKSSMTRLTTSIISKSTPSSGKTSALEAVDDLESELSLAIKTKVSIIGDELERARQAKQSCLESWKVDCAQFWQLYDQLSSATTENQLESVMNRFKEAHELPPSHSPFVCL